jgi:hypothetical protein
MLDAADQNGREAAAMAEFSPSARPVSKERVRQLQACGAHRWSAQDRWLMLLFYPRDFSLV